MAINEGCDDLVVIVQKDEIGVGAEVKCALAIGNTKKLSWMKGGCFDGVNEAAFYDEDNEKQLPTRTRG